MQDFDSLYARVAPPVLDAIFNDVYLGGVYALDRNGYFTDVVKKISGLEVSLTEGKTNHNFPQASLVSIHAKRLGFSVRAQATGFVRDTSEMMLHTKARGEFLERLSASVPLDTLIQNNFDTESVARIVPRQLAVKKMFGFGSRTVSAAKVYYTLSRTAPFRSESYYHQPTTNGGAGHFSARTASLFGLLELIQRDAFLVHWLNTISPKKIVIDGSLGQKESENFYALMKFIADCERYHITCHFLDITSDIPVPAVCCALTMDSPTGKRLYLGGAAGFDGVASLLSAAGEAVTNASGYYFKEPYTLKEPYVPFTDATLGREERIRLYATDDMYERARFFLSSSETVTVSDWESVGGALPAAGYTAKELVVDTHKALAYLKSIFSKRAADDPRYEVLVYEVKNALLKKFSYKVVRVLCDGLYSLYLQEHYAQGEHPRLREFVTQRKLESVATQNIWPHPFP